MLIQEAIQKTEVTHKKTKTSQGGESLAHKELKEYVASHPEKIGLPQNALPSIEHSFPSGDRVDIIFDLGNNKWTVVEIELEGLTQNFIGLFQVVKYRALQQAILKTQEITGEVRGHLVAYSIPDEIKKYAKLLDITTIELSISS